jgi:3-methyladenine DNA glycosylase Mpg
VQNLVVSNQYLHWLELPTPDVGIPVDRDRSFRFVVTGDSGLS